VEERLISSFAEIQAIDYEHQTRHSHHPPRPVIPAYPDGFDGGENSSYLMGITNGFRTGQADLPLPILQ